MTDTSQEIYVYIVPAERRNGDEPSCRVLIKGNTHPQQIRGTAENYIKYLMKSMVSTTGKEGACHALHEGAKTSRGKVWELPNGQFLSPVQILAEKGGTGYVSLGEIVGVYAEQGIGVIQFCGESVTLKTAMKVKGLYDCISKASRRYLKGHKDSDVVLRFIGEKEKQEMQDARDPEGAEKGTALQKSLLLGSIDFIHQCPPEDQSRIIDDVYKFLWRSHMRGQKYGSGTINYIKACFQTMLKKPMTPEEERRAALLAQHPERLLPWEEIVPSSEMPPAKPVAEAGEGQKYWPAISPKPRKKETYHAVTFSDTMRDVQSIVKGAFSWQDHIRDALKSPMAESIAKAMQTFAMPSPALQELSKSVAALGTVPKEWQAIGQMGRQMPRIHSPILTSAAAFKMPGLDPLSRVKGTTSSAWQMPGLASMMPAISNLSQLNTSMGMIPPMPHALALGQPEELDRWLMKHKKKEETDQKS